MNFRVSWVAGDLFWIHVALSTLKPATSPCLSAVRLDFAHPAISSRSVEDAINGTGNDLLRVADEVSRIEREFEGAVNVTVLRDLAFKGVLDTLNVRFYSCRAGDSPRTTNSFPLFSCRSFSIEIAGIDLQNPIICSIGQFAVLNHLAIRAASWLTETSGYRVLRLGATIYDPAKLEARPLHIPRSPFISITHSCAQFTDDPGPNLPLTTLSDTPSICSLLSYGLRFCYSKHRQSIPWRILPNMGVAERGMMALFWIQLPTIVMFFSLRSSLTFISSHSHV